MKYIICNIILLVLYSNNSATTSVNQNKVPLSAYRMYDDLYHYKKGITLIKSLSLNNKLNYKMWDTYEDVNNRMRFKYGHCKAFMVFLGKSEAIVNASMSKSLSNDIVYEFYSENLRYIVKECL